MYFLIFILIIFYFFILRPYLKVRKVMKDAQRQANEFFGGAGSTYGSNQGPHSRQQRGKPYPHRRHKKIDPDVGEYIEFEEITTVTTYTYTETKYETEEQISDAEWEDCPPPSRNARR